MKIVVIGGTGRIGSMVVAVLTEQGHETVPASPRLGVNTVTGVGLAETLAGASVLVDVSNPPDGGGQTPFEFFERSTRNLLAAEGSAGVRHHVALSIVGTPRPSLRTVTRERAVATSRPSWPRSSWSRRR